LAALYMDHLGRIEDAWAALDAAFDSGFEGRDWLVRMLTCSVLLNKKDSIDGLMYGLTHNFKKESADSMIAEAKEMVQSLIEKYKERPAASQSDQPATTENDS